MGMKPIPPIDFVHKQLQDANIPEVAEQTGLSARWLHLIRNQKIPNPGVVMLDRLAKHFGRSIMAVKK